MIQGLQEMVQAVQSAAGPAAAAALGFAGLEQAVAAQAQPVQQHMQQAIQQGLGLQHVMHNLLDAAGGAEVLGPLFGEPLPPPHLPQGAAAPAAHGAPAAFGAAAANAAAAPAAIGAVNNPAAVLQFIALANHTIHQLQQLALQQAQQQGGQAQQQGGQAQQQGVAGGGGPLMGAAPQQHVQGAAAAGAAVALGQGQAVLQGALQRPTAEVMEPHLHFLCRMDSLGKSSAGCQCWGWLCLVTG
jgi:hypothetical protein